MYSGLLIVIVPLLIGYLLPVRHPRFAPWISKVCGWMVYIILFLMGASLSYLDNLTSNLQHIFSTAVVFLSASALSICWRCASWISVGNGASNCTNKTAFAPADGG